MNNFKTILALLIFFSSAACYAADAPLKYQVRTHLPSSITNVGEAANYFISPHGYKITVIGSAPIESYSIVRQDVPASFPKGSVKSIEVALLSLLRPSQILIIDNNSKLISFGNRGSK